MRLFSLIHRRLSFLFKQPSLPRNQQADASVKSVLFVRVPPSSPMTNNFQAVGEAFTKTYYGLFDSDRSQLQPLYREQSMLSFEGAQFMGAQSIVQKLVELPFQKVQHQIVTCDCQPTLAATPNGILISVNGNLIIDDNTNPMKFAQCFHLIPDPASPSNYWVHNDIFRLNLG